MPESSPNILKGANPADLHLNNGKTSFIQRGLKEGSVVGQKEVEISK